MMAKVVAKFAMLLAMSISSVAMAQDFSGKQITVIAGDAAGSAYTNYAQLVHRHLGRHLRGSPAVHIKMMPGADSLIAANYLSDVAPRDGTVIAALYRGLPTEPLLQGPDAHGKFDPRALTWIASLNAEVSLAIAWRSSAVKSAAGPGLSLCRLAAFRATPPCSARFSTPSRARSSR